MTRLVIPLGCVAVVVIASLIAAPVETAPVAASDPAGCPPCHARRRPAWHDDGVTSPGRDPAARRAHADAARQRGGCAACHRAGFVASCSSCHDATERWRTAAEVR
ncbi:MAG: hypothetical protein H6709_17510 [Kofleriaceae bacterium]|nr:hypothetical protein [Kofleriaceae bacterium]MCB9573881.1 hypothetical protein [Kofleriaceae bacterium]